MLPARTQSCVAVTADGDQWFLINASPDLRAQIEVFPALHPRPGTPRNSPIAGVLVTNADLDHVLGLLLLREGSRLHVYAPPAVRNVLTDYLRMDAVFGAFNGIMWHDAPAVATPLCTNDGNETGLTVRAIPLPSDPPRFSGRAASPGEVHGVAYEITDTGTGARLLVAPDVGEITVALEDALIRADAVLFDGTFWSDDELRAINPDARTSLEMGHLPILTGSLRLLSSLPAEHKLYIHINNTNPILADPSPESLIIAHAGLVISEDGMDFQL